MDRIRRDSLLGLVFFGTLAFLLWATINLTDMSMGKVPPLEVFFADAGGAQVGTSVLVLGKKVGKVGAIDVIYAREQNPVRMQLLLQEAVPLTDKMRIEVQDAGVLGGKQIFIDPGRGALWPADREMIGRLLKSAFDRIGEIGELSVGSVGDVAIWSLTGPAFSGAIADPIEAWLRCGPVSARDTIVHGKHVVRNHEIVSAKLESMLKSHAKLAHRMQKLAAN